MPIYENQQYDKTGWPVKRADGIEYVLASTKQPTNVRVFPFIATFVVALILAGIFALGWLASGWQDQTTTRPPTIEPTTQAILIPTETPFFPALQTEIAHLWTATPSKTPTPKPTMVKTLTVEEQKYATLPFCHDIDPSRTPVECVQLKTAIAPPPTATPTQTPIPFCDITPLPTPLYGQSAVTKICFYVEPLWIPVPLW